MKEYNNNIYDILNMLNVNRESREHTRYDSKVYGIVIFVPADRM